jgi:hypothetical protein
MVVDLWPGAVCISSPNPRDVDIIHRYAMDQGPNNPAHGFWTMDELGTLPELYRILPPPIFGEKEV